ncbi:MAG: anthranilate synthase component I [Chloroflexia bacterium]
MLFPSRREFRRLARDGRTVPVWCERPADLETPISVYLKLRGDGPSFLLESVEKGEHLGRYSFLGVRPKGALVAQDDLVWWHTRGEFPQQMREKDPLEAARTVLSRYRAPQLPGLPRLCGGLVGYLSYEAARWFEPVPLARAPGVRVPDACWLLTDTLVVFDHVQHGLLLMAYASSADDPDRAYDRAAERIEELLACLEHPSVAPPGPTAREIPPWESNVEPERFEQAVRRAKSYIAAGDIFQVVLSQRFSRPTAADPLSIYRTLRRLNPSPYMFFLELPGELTLIGSSPEMLVRLDGRHAELRPIAGTRPRGHDGESDRLLAEELLTDAKERAEHVMLVDLGRNDLGRVCEYGSVRVPELMTVERYSHVMHLVSRVEGVLRPDLDAFDLLRAAFPAGTVSGAPKIRAMEIIAELEEERRGPYAGAVGYFSLQGNMDTCITIRTVVLHRGTAYVQAGAGIVADSDPTREYQETCQKARALMEAVDLAEVGDDRCHRQL